MKLIAREKITKIAALVFASSCVAMAIGIIAVGEAAVAWVTIGLAYPALIVLFANVGIADLHALWELIIKSKKLESGLAPMVVFSVGRGACFLYGAVLFIYMEVKAVQSVL